MFVVLGLYFFTLTRLVCYTVKSDKKGIVSAVLSVLTFAVLLLFFSSERRIFAFSTSFIRHLAHFNNIIIPILVFAFFVIRRKEKKNVKNEETV